MLLVDSSESPGGGMEELLVFSTDRHRGAAGEDFPAGAASLKQSDCLGAAEVEQLPRIAVQLGGPARTGAVVVDLDGVRAAAFVRAVLAAAVDEDPSRVAFVAVLGRVSEDLSEGVAVDRLARVVDRVRAELLELAQAWLIVTGGEAEGHGKCRNEG